MKWIVNLLSTRLKVDSLVDSIGPSGLFAELLRRVQMTDVIGFAITQLRWVCGIYGRDVVERAVTIREDVLRSWGETIHGEDADAIQRVVDAMEDFAIAFADLIESFMAKRS